MPNGVQLPGKPHYLQLPKYGTNPSSAMAQMSSSQYTHGPSNGAAGHPYPPSQQPFDQTGQVAPPGMKPRVTATLWEDEGSLCFQVEAKGVCVARREGKLRGQIWLETG